MSICNYSHVTFDKQAKTYAEQKPAPSTNGSGKTGYPYIE